MPTPIFRNVFSGLAGTVRAGYNWLNRRLDIWNNPIGLQVPVIQIDKERQELAEEMRAYAGISYRHHGRFAENFTQETQEMREVYRKATAEPSVKAALIGKVGNVMSLDLQVTPANKANPIDAEIADFIKHSLTNCEIGLSGIIWEILFHGCMDGWSVCEKNYAVEDRGRFRGKWVLKNIKAKDTRFIFPLVDAFKNIIGFVSRHNNAAKVFKPGKYIVYSHLSMFQNPNGVSDLRAAYRAMKMIPDVLRLRMVFLDKYSGPYIHGKIGDAALKKKLLTELQQARGSGVLVTDDSTDIEIVDLASRGTSDFTAGLQDLRQEVATGISGAFLHMMVGDTPGARGDSQVQKDTVELFVWMLAEQIKIIFRRFLVREMVDWNYGAQYDLPTVTLEAVNPDDVKRDLGIDQVLDGMGVDLSMEELRERARRSGPKDDNDSLQQFKIKIQKLAQPPQPPAPTGPPDQTGGLLNFADLPAGYQALVLPEEMARSLTNLSAERLATVEEQYLDVFAEATKYTGSRKDRLGRTLCYREGIRVPCDPHPEDQTKRIPSADKTFANRAHADPARRRYAATHYKYYADNPHELDAAEMHRMPSVLADLTVPQLKELKRNYGVRGGKRKDEYIAKLKGLLGSQTIAAATARTVPANDTSAVATPAVETPKPEKKKVTVKLRHDADREIINKLIPNATEDDIGSIACAPDGAEVKVAAIGNNGIDLTVEHEGVTTHRSIFKRGDKVTCENHLFVIRPGSPHRGNGYRVFADQVAALTKAGVDEIETMGAGTYEGSLQGGMNGYYTWPRLGYDAKIDSHYIDKMPAEMRTTLDGKKTMRNLFDNVPGGIDWWKKNGRSKEFAFDLSANSPSQKALAAYVAEREKKANG